MAITTKNDICNMTLSHLGNYGTVTDIDLGTSSKELVFKLWYDVTRQAALRLCIPNFAMERRKVAKLDVTPAFGYRYAYEYPSDCLKVLGVGEIDDKAKEFTIEGGRIYLEKDYPDGLPIRFIKDFEDVSAMDSDFQILLSFMLAPNVALPITQKQSIVKQLEQMLPSKISMLSGTNAQENPPIRISHSKIKQSRYSDPSRNGVKR